MSFAVVLLLFAVAAAGVVALRRAPAAVLTVLAAVGFATGGDLPLPGSVHAQVSASKQQLREWQDVRIQGFVCYGRLRQAADSQTPAAINRAERACQPASAR